jgi:uncharacterized repeat protein (TIGR01451 family)
MVLSFGYEAITDVATRQAVMQRAIDYFTSPRQAAGLSLRPASQTLIARPGDAVTHTLVLRNTSEITTDTVTLGVVGGAWPHSFSPATAKVDSCRTVTVTLAVTVPSGLDWKGMDVVTLTAQSSLSSSVVALSVLRTKTPAPVLMVDDDRWYEVEGAYTQALTLAGVAYDTWQVNGNAQLNSPPASRLEWYPVVVWFTGYDWYDPINATDEANLSTFLNSGGRLFLSSPFYLDIAGYYRRGLPTFAQTHLGVLTYTDGLTTSVAYGSADDPIGDGLDPLSLTDPYPQAGFFTLAEALTPGRDARTALRGSSGRALAIHQAGTNGRTVFMIAPFEALTGLDAERVMARILGWLGWLGDSTLAADRDVAAGGDRVTFTLSTRHNGPAQVHATVTATVPLSVTLVPGSLTPGAAFDPATGRVMWAGALDPGAAVTLTYQITLDAALPAGTPLTTTAIFRDDTHGIPFDQSAVVRVAAPDLEFGTFVAPSPVRPNAPLTYTLVVSNSGLVPAASAHVTVLLPVQTRIVTGSLRLFGPGSITTANCVLDWSGPLSVGESVTLTYQLIAAGMLTGRTLLSEALLEDGAGGAWERVLWVDVTPYRYSMPLIIKQ